MYSQFFGNYLLSKNIITPAQLVDAIKDKENAEVFPSLLAVYSNLITAENLEYIVTVMEENGTTFKDTAISLNYITEEEYDNLKNIDIPDYLIIGQCLINAGVLSISETYYHVVDYQSDDELIDLDIFNDQKDNFNKLISRLFISDGYELPEYIATYINLLFTNLISFIGEDFTPLTLIPCDEFPVSHCAYQEVKGSHSLTIYIDVEEPVAIEFASLYVGEQIIEVDEYVKASLEDFLNLNNGLFNVNLSNDSSIEMDLEPPMIYQDPVISQAEGKRLFMLPIVYPFGTLNFLFEIPE